MMIRAVARWALPMVLTWCAAGANAAGYPLRIEAIADEDGVWQVIAHNRGSSAVYMHLELTQPKNVRPSGSNKTGPKVLEPGAREVIVEAVPIEPEEEVSFDWNLKWNFGRGTGKGNHDGLYRPPFPGDLTFETNNSASEHPVRELHAIDILMPPDTPVIAARSGWVLDVSGEQGGDRVEGGLRPTYITDRDVARMGSYIRILHDDGTWAEYMGVKEGSIKVTPGVKVEAGTQIALSGERLGAEPHLTFVVMKPTGAFNAPESLPIKMEMAGRGVVAVVAGNAIGASLSVAPGANLVRADPLVIAQVEKGKVSEKAGSMALGSGLVKSNEQIVVAAAALLALLIGAGGWWVRKSKGELSWREWLGRRKQVESDEGMEESNEETEGEDSNAYSFEAARLKGDLRPKKGQLIADWELGVYSALGIALPPGYAVMVKVSLNRLFGRPTKWQQYVEAQAQMRGESVDFAVVQLRDTRIVAAIDIKRETVQMPWTESVNMMRMELLAKAGIKHMVVEANVGPEELRKALKQVVADEVVRPTVALAA